MRSLFTVLALTGFFLIADANDASAQSRGGRRGSNVIITAGYGTGVYFGSPGYGYGTAYASDVPVFSPYVYSSSYNAANGYIPYDSAVEIYYNPMPGYYYQSSGRYSRRGR